MIPDVAIRLTNRRRGVGDGVDVDPLEQGLAGPTSLEGPVDGQLLEYQKVLFGVGATSLAKRATSSASASAGTVRLNSPISTASPAVTIVPLRRKISLAFLGPTSQVQKAAT